MLYSLSKRSVFLFIFLLFTKIIVLTCCPDKDIIIRNKYSKLILDGTDPEVKSQPYNGAKSQIWYLEYVGSGMFYIVLSSNNKVLDIQGDGSLGKNLITAYRYGAATQKWHINSDSTIVSATGMAIDVRGSNFSAGANVIAYVKQGHMNQQYLIQELIN